MQEDLTHPDRIVATVDEGLHDGGIQVERRVHRATQRRVVAQETLQRHVAWKQPIRVDGLVGSQRNDLNSSHIVVFNKRDHTQGPSVTFQLRL